MINVLKYQDVKRLEITDTDGKVWRGKFLEIVDSEEQSDLAEKDEDSIVIQCDGQCISFYASEIKSIRILE